MANSTGADRRNLLKLGTIGLAAAATLDVHRAAAQATSASLLRTVLDRGKLIVGTGSTNAPWHFEDTSGKLTGMDIAMGRVDIVIQFMTISAQRAQLVNFSRPYYVEGVALLTLPDAKIKTFDQLMAAGKNARVSVLQNVGADDLVHQVLPDAQVMQLDTQANVVQALQSHRVDGAAVDLSTVRWMVKQDPTKYADAGKTWRSMLYGAALPQGDLDWLTYVNQVFNCAMFGHENEIFDKAFKDYFGEVPT